TMSQCSTFWISGIRASKNALVSGRVLNIFQLPAIMGRLIYLFVSTSTPGSFCPDKNSSDAPPPVEMCVILDSTPAWATAAAESPPPTMEKEWESATAQIGRAHV